MIELPDMITIPAGCFMMGTVGEDRFANSTERPAHEVVIENPFAVSRFPVTEAQWTCFEAQGRTTRLGRKLVDRPSRSISENQGRDALDTSLRPRRIVRHALPVVCVSWHDAMCYVSWLSAQTRKPFRLLTEAEWEYACRAGSTTIFSVGDTLEPEHANYFYDEHGFKVGPGHRTPPGSNPPNAFGLEDMHGNVCEWVADAWRANYSAEPDEAHRVIRGGAWDYMPRLLRSAWRDFAAADTKRDNLGFRIACDL